eukprot:scaffold214576_cov22-Tisochrysis_lutea.AAC.1
MEAAIMGRTAVVYVLLEQPNIDPNRCALTLTAKPYPDGCTMAPTPGYQPQQVRLPQKQIVEPNRCLLTLRAAAAAVQNTMCSC